jgi:hypothetical protein
MRIKYTLEYRNLYIPPIYRMHMDEFVKKSITIRPDQDEFLKNMPINLSKFIQMKLDEFIKELEGCKDNNKPPT